MKTTDEVEQSRISQKPSAKTASDRDARRAVRARGGSTLLKWLDPVLSEVQLDGMSAS